MRGQKHVNTIFMAYVNVHQRVTSAGEGFNDQRDRMTHCVGTVSLFLATRVIARWASEQSSWDGRNGDHIGVQQHGLPLTKADLSMTTIQCPTCLKQRPTLELRTGCHSPV